MPSIKLLICYHKKAPLFKDDILIFSTELKVLLLVCVFITLYLIILFFFNIKQDDQAIIKDKIKKFKIALINEYLENTDNVDWDEVSKFLAVRKHQINHDIRHYLGKKAETHKVLVDNLLEKTWDDVENVILNHEKLYTLESIKKRTFDNSDQGEDEEYIPELYEEVEEVEYVDKSEKSYNEWGDEEEKEATLTFAEFEKWI